VVGESNYTAGGNVEERRFNAASCTLRQFGLQPRRRATGAKAQNFMPHDAALEGPLFHGGAGIGVPPKGR